MPTGIYVRTKPVWNKGKIGIYSEETKRKIGLCHKGKILSEENKKKLIEGGGMLGKHHSEETRKKLSEAQKRNPSRGMLGKRHTKETCKKLSTIHKGKNAGEKSHLWKGGITSENKKQRNSLEFKAWRNSVFERDDFTCQKFNVRGGKLVSHHIKNFAQFPELRFSVDNGITLSERAHIDFHKKYGKSNNTKSQLQEFLKNG